MIFEEGEKSYGCDNTVIYSGMIDVVPNQIYKLKIEVLRNDLGDECEQVSDITMNNVSVG